MAGITYIDYYIPEEEVSISDLLDRIDVKSVPPCFKTKQEYAGFIEKILKLKSLRVETKLDAAAMISKLIERMFRTQDVKAEEIDVIMFAQEPHFFQQENIAKYLQYKYKMDNAYTVNISGNLCANNEIALSAADSLCQSRKDVDNILIVSATKTEGLDKRLFGTFSIVGDAAGIMLFSRTKSREKYYVKLLDNVIMSDGSFHDVNVNDDNSLLHCKSYSKCIVDLIKKNSLKNENIDTIMIPNANSLLVSQCLAAAGLKTDKIFLDNLSKYGHLDCVDFLINLKDILDDGVVDINSDGYIFSFGTGATGSYVSSLLSFS